MTIGWSLIFVSCKTLDAGEQQKSLQRRRDNFQAVRRRTKREKTPTNVARGTQQIS